MSLYNNENKNENFRMNIYIKENPKDILQNLLGEYLNKRLIKLENSTNEHMSDLKNLSKNFNEFSKNINQISNNIMEQIESKEKSKNNEINNNNSGLKQSIKKLNELENKIVNAKKINKNISNLRARSNTLGLNKFNQFKKQKTESNLSRESLIFHNKKEKLKSIEKNNKNINLSKELGKNATPKKISKIDFTVENKSKYPQTEKIPKKLDEKIKKLVKNKNSKNNQDFKFKTEFEQLTENDNMFVINNINSSRKEKKDKIKKDIIKTKKADNESYSKKEPNQENKKKESNINLKSSFVSRKVKKNILNDLNNINNSNSNFSDVQNIVKLVDNVHQNITKLLNGNNSLDFSLPNSLRNSVKLPTKESNFTSKKGDFTLKKKYLSKKEKVKNIDAMEIFKKDKSILKNILKYLNENEKIFFYSINNYFNKERITFFDNKKEELLSVLNLKKDESIENKINEIKNIFSIEDFSKNSLFQITEETKNKILEINNEDFLNEFKNMEDNNNNIYLMIIYKILFIFLGEDKIYNTLNSNIFWEKCYDYFNKNCENKLGEFLLKRIPLFNFGTKEFNKIENLIKDKKIEIINEISNNTKYLIIPLIKEALEYIGIIFSKEKTEASIYIKNLKNNQIIINYLNNLKVRYFLSKYNEEEEEI